VEMRCAVECKTVTHYGGDKNTIKTIEKRESEREIAIPIVSCPMFCARPQASDLRGARFVLRVLVLSVLSVSIQPLLLLHGGPGNEPN